MQAAEGGKLCAAAQTSSFHGIGSGCARFRSNAKMGFLDSLKKIIVGDEASPDTAASPPPKPAAADHGEGAEGIENALRELIAEQSDGELTAAEVPPKAQLLDEGVLDSLSSAKLISFIDETYGVHISESDLAGRLATLEDLVAHVAANSVGEGAQA